MSTIQIFVIATLVGIVIWWLVCLIWLKPWNIKHLYMRLFWQLGSSNPELLTMLGLLERIGVRGHNSKLADVSEAKYDKDYTRLERGLRSLRSYSRKRQSPEILLSTDILDWFMDDQVRYKPFRHHDYPFNQMFGVQSETANFMLTIHPINNVRDARDHVKRLSKFGVKFNQGLEGMRIREKKGVIPPQFVIRRILDEMIAFSEMPASKNALYTVYEEKLAKIKITPIRRQKLLEAVEIEIRDSVFPAYKKLIEYFSYLEPIANQDDGVWKLPDGEAYYAQTLRNSTTTEFSADQIHDMGIKEVARIENEMKNLLNYLGYKDVKNAPQFLKKLSDEERFHYPNTDEGREESLKAYGRILEEIDVSISPVFDVRPKAALKVERVPKFRELTSAGAYYQMPDMGGKRPGVFFANLRDMKEVHKFGMKTLAYHEGIPGHHFQLAIAQELRGLPFFRKLVPFIAYAEGWALYAEKLAREQGAYKDDPYGELGYLDSELFRAVRLVVDTGIHQMRWTRQKAIDYMLSHTAASLESVTSEIERYIVMPGQACSYKVGEIKIVAMREKAIQALGEKFSLRNFHNVILQNGAMSLSLLEQVVDAYIQKELAPE
jgi:uncharacterized protein (DUF885 family)